MDDVIETPTPDQETIPEKAVAQEPETTASPEPDTLPEDSTEEEAPEKVYTQAELDAIIGKRLARERRSFEREQQAARPSTPEPIATGEPTREQFDSDEAFDDARIDYRANVRAYQRQVEEDQRKVADAHFEREEKARERYDDFDTVAKNPNLPISPLMADVLRRTESGPDIIYHLGQNPAEARRIYDLPPILQAKELGKLEAKLASEPPTRKVSSAPAPITPIRTPASKPIVHDTTDPRSAETLSVDDWVAAENKREQARLEARFH